jgi:hypothetical protein
MPLGNSNLHITQLFGVVEGDWAMLSVAQQSNPAAFC